MGKTGHILCMKTLEGYKIKRFSEKTLDTQAGLVILI